MTWVGHAVVVPERQGQPDARRAGPAHVRGARDRPVAPRRASAVAAVSWSRSACRSAPRPRRLAVPALALAVVGAVLLIVLPFSYRQALMVSMAGMVVCLSLVVITGFVGQVSLAQVTLAGVAGFAVSHMAAKAGIGFPWGPLVGSAAAVVIGLVVGLSALRVRGVSLAVVTLAGVVAIEQFGFANRRWGAGSTGSPVEQPELFGVRLGLQRRVPRARRQSAQPGARVRVPGRRRGPVPARRQSAPQRARPADAVGAGQRAGRRGRRASTSPTSRSRRTRSRRSSPARRGGCTPTTSARSVPPGSAS